MTSLMAIAPYSLAPQSHAQHDDDGRPVRPRHYHQERLVVIDRDRDIARVAERLENRRNVERVIDHEHPIIRVLGADPRPMPGFSATSS
jgi:hypothetical protein